jgi:8-hydroxy-5-deazaflavin:NADPH oxidoreductase
MHIGIIGSGKIGATAARLFVNPGHDAFNTTLWMAVRERRSHGPMDARLVLFVAGDDEDAQSRVSGLIEAIGFAPVDTGGLAEGGRRQEPGSPVFVNELRRDQAANMLTEPT